MSGMRLFLSTRFVFAALLGAVLIAPAAHAADPPKKKEGAFGKGGGAFLSKEQLRSCLSQKDRIAQSDDDLLKERAALGGIKDELARSGEALKEGFNGRVEAAKPEREAYSKACDNRRFFEDDEIAIKKGK